MERQGQVRDEAEGEGADGAQGGGGGGEGDGKGEQLTEGAAQRHLQSRRDGGMVVRLSGGCDELSRREGVGRTGTYLDGVWRGRAHGLVWAGARGVHVIVIVRSAATTAGWRVRLRLPHLPPDPTRIHRPECM